MSDKEISEYIGIRRFLEYSYLVGDKSIETAIELYKFDMHFRALLMKALAIIEITLITGLQNSGLQENFESFGQARRALDKVAVHQQYVFAGKFSLRNQKQLKSCLIHLNHLRNRVAHHERVWNCQNKFSLPPLRKTKLARTYGVSKSPFVMAASLNLLVQMLSGIPPFFDLEAEFEVLVGRTPVSRGFLLRSMGFEVS